MRKSVSKSAWEGAKGLPNPPKCFENAFRKDTHCYVGVFLSSI
jgi:hypothetical protein